MRDRGLKREKTNEQFIIKSERRNITKIMLIIAGVLSALSVIACIYIIIQNYSAYKQYREWFYYRYKDYPSGNFLGEIDYYLLGIIFIVNVIIWAIAAIYIYAFSKTVLYVTDCRVYGVTIFSKKVDLPVDMITAVGTGWKRTIAVSTPSGRIRFMYIDNRDEVYSCIIDLLIDRQRKDRSAAQDSKKDTEDLKKYKDWLDYEIITQEEFDKKKEQLLNS